MTPRHPASAALAAYLIFVICFSVPADQTTPPSTLPSNQWGLIYDGLQSSIRVDPSQFAPTDPILVHYCIRNVSDHPQQVWHTGFWPTNRIDVTTPDGHAAPLTPYGQRKRDQFGGKIEKSYPVTLQPRQSDEDFPLQNLRDLFIFQTPGTYTIQYAYKQNPDNLLSNSLQIIVTEK